MKTYHKNPRIITEKQFEDLRSWLRKLGDLSGIVHNIRTDEIISGNQRSLVVDINNCEIQIIEEQKKPDRQGTLAVGFIIWEGSKYNYRRVDWDPETEEMANIVANKAGGSWDWDLLANEFDLDKLLEWGFDEEELQIPDFTVPDPDPLEDPSLPSEVFIEIYCSKEDLDDFKDILDDWAERQNGKVNIS